MHPAFEVMAGNTLYLQLKQLIQECDGSEVGINSIIRYCLQNREINDKKIITTCFEQLLAGSRLIQTKMAAVKIMTHIILQDSQKYYIRAFSQRFSSFLEKQRFEIKQSQEAINTFIDILNIWTGKKVFCDTFYAKLISQAGQDLMEKVKKQIDSSHFKKYSKSFLMMYRDIQRVSEAKQIYKLNRLRKLAQAKYSSILPSDKKAEQVMEQISSFDQADQQLQKANDLIKDYCFLLQNLMGNSEQLKNSFFSQLSAVALKQTDLQDTQENLQLIVN